MKLTAKMRNTWLLSARMDGSLLPNTRVMIPGNKLMSKQVESMEMVMNIKDLFRTKRNASLSFLPI